MDAEPMPGGGWSEEEVAFFRVTLTGFQTLCK